MRLVGRGGGAGRRKGGKEGDELDGTSCFRTIQPPPARLHSSATTKPKSYSNPI